MDTRGYTGKVRKSATVHTNDPTAASLVIVLEATIRPLISLTPPTLVLQGQAGQVATGTVEIKGRKDRPLHLNPVHFDLLEKVNYQLEEVEPGFYRARFSNVPGLSGISHGQLRLKTNYPEKPEIVIRIRCRFGT